MFSTFNNLNDLTLQNGSANLLGITDDELKKYFHPYIERAAKILSMPVNDLYASLKARYDGFKFSPDSQETLYNPWSILKFLLNPEEGFANYWFESGGTPELLINYLKIKQNFDILEYKHRYFQISENELASKTDISNITPQLLLLQAGYFTLCGFDKTYLKFSFSNSEVEESILNSYIIINNLNISEKTAAFIYKFEEIIDSLDLKSIINIFNLILNDCVYPRSHFFNDEYTLRDLIFAIIPTDNEIFKLKEREYIKGHSDLELITRKTHLIIEFKLTNQNRSAKKSLAEGIEQVKSRNYGKTAFLSQKLFRIVLVHHIPKRDFYLNFLAK